MRRYNKAAAAELGEKEAELAKLTLELDDKVRFSQKAGAGGDKAGRCSLTPR